MVTIEGIREKIRRCKRDYTEADTFTQVSNIDYSILLYLSKVEYALLKGKFAPQEKREIYRGYYRLKKLRGDI